MFQTKWFRAVLVLAVLASLLVTPLLANAQETYGFTSPEDGATISGVAKVMAMTPTEGFARWELLVFPGGNDSALATIYVAGGDTLGEVSYDLDTTIFPDGDHVLALRVVKADSNYEDYRTNVTIANAGAPAVAETEPVVAVTAPVTPTATTTPTVAAAAAPAAAAPVNGITSPAANAKVSGAATVEGYANDPNFMKWQLDVLPGGDANAAIFVALGETAGEFSQALDTTAFPDGDHALRLRVVKNDSNYDEYVTPFTLANAAAPAAAAAPAPAATAAVTATAATTATAAPAPAAVATPAPAAAAKPAGEPGISSPADGATISGVATVMAMAPTEGFERWELLVFPGGNDSDLAKIYVTGGSDLGEVSYDLDTTIFPDGDHVLALRVVRPDTSYEDYRVNVTVANAAAQ